MLPLDKELEIHMTNHKIQWVNDRPQICDRLDERLQLMQDYLDSKSDGFDGIAVKRFLLHQADEQIACYRQSIDTRTCYDTLQEIEARDDFQSPGVSQTTDTPTPSASRG